MPEELFRCSGQQVQPAESCIARIRFDMLAQFGGEPPVSVIRTDAQGPQQSIVSEQFNPGRRKERVLIPGQHVMLDVRANVFSGETICRQEFSYYREFIPVGHREGDSVRWCWYLDHVISGIIVHRGRTVLRTSWGAQAALP